MRTLRNAGLRTSMAIAIAVLLSGGASSVRAWEQANVRPWEQGNGK